MPIFDATKNIPTPIERLYRLPYMSKHPGHSGARIKEKRRQLKMSQAALGKAVGVSQPVISSWENEEHEILGINLVLLAKSLGTTVEYLIGKKETKAPRESQYSSKTAASASEWDSSTPVDSDEVEVPLFVDLEIAAGPGKSVGYEHRGPMLRFSRSSLRKANVPPESAFFVKIRGDSMLPKYEDGGEAGFNRAATKIIDGEEYAINHDGLARFKVLYRLPGNKIRIHSYNTAEYPDEIVDMKDVYVVGQLFSYQKMKRTG